jgi:hypothetical protein
MSLSTKERQKQYRERLRDQGREPITIYLSEYERGILAHYKSQLNIKSDSEACQYIIGTFHKLTHQK